VSEMKKEKLICLKQGNDVITIYGFKPSNRWNFTMIYSGKEIRQATATSWNDVLYWLNQYPWQNMNIESGVPDFIKKIEKAKQSGPKMYYQSQQRVLDLYVRLKQGEKLNLQNLCYEYSKHAETIKEDIRSLRSVLEHYGEMIVYNSKDKLYELMTSEHSLTIGEAFVLLILLYHSRSLNKEECEQIEAKIMEMYSLQEQQKLKRFFCSYNYHYQSFQKERLLEKIDMIFQAILQKKCLSFNYQKDGTKTERIVQPLSVVFHDHAFYVAAKLVNKNKQNPIYFRIDRITDLNVLKQSFPTNEKHEYFQAGAYKNLAFNMFTGDEIIVKIKTVKWLEEYVYRAFAHAKKVAENETSIIMEMKVFGTEGILFWILAQQERVEVLEPLFLREKIKEKIIKLAKLYEI